jgi:hypothetical protein
MPRSSVISRDTRFSVRSWPSTTICRSSANGITTEACGGIGSVTPSPITRFSPYTVTGPDSRVESVGFSTRTARNA